jgi:hypothetical protein
MVRGLSRYKSSLEKIGFEDKCEHFRVFVFDPFSVIVNDGVTVNCLIFS